MSTMPKPIKLRAPRTLRYDADALRQTIRETEACLADPRWSPAARIVLQFTLNRNRQLLAVKERQLSLFTQGED